MTVTVVVQGGLEAAAEAAKRLGPGPVHRLEEERFAPCLGCFECWTAHPGTCRAHDAANDLMRDVIGAEELVWVVRPIAGSWPAEVKQALDKLIGLVSPFFATVHGETHHVARYDRYPRFGVVAVADAAVGRDEREAFRLLVARNALNFHSEASWVAFVGPDAGADEVAAAIDVARADPWTSFPELRPFPSRADAVGVPRREGRRALLVVGSAKPAGTSTSEHLGRALLDRLAARGWATDTLFVARAVRFRRQRQPAFEEAVAAADLVILAAPVYVDGLPALVLAGLESLRATDRRAVWLPLVQCGFPELTHTALALGIAARFVDRLGHGWAGHLALGAGTPFATAALDAPTGMAARQVQALDQVAAALDAGQPVPVESAELFAKTPLSPFFYRTVGQLGWVAQAFGHGAVGSLGARPFEP